MVHSHKRWSRYVCYDKRAKHFVDNQIAPVGCGNTTSDRGNPPVDIKEDDKIDMECPSTETEAPVIPDEVTATPRAAGPRRSCRVPKPIIRYGFDS